MAFRLIPLEKRVNAIKECIRIENTKEIANKYGISESTLVANCNELLDETTEIFKKKSLVGKLKTLLRKAFHR